MEQLSTTKEPEKQQKSTEESTGTTTPPPGNGNLMPPWKPGQSGNPAGRKPGQRDFATIYREALIKLASKNNMEPDELEQEMVANALLSARKGSFKFYKDIMDRLHGKAVQPIAADVNHNVESIADLISHVQGAKEAKIPQPEATKAPEKNPEPVDPANRPDFQLPTK